MINFRKYSLIALAVIVILGAFATIAIGAGGGTLSTLLDYGTTLIILIVLLLCTQYLSWRLGIEARRVRNDTEQFSVNISGAVASLERTNGELQRLIRLNVDELASLKGRVALLETKIDVIRVIIESAEDEVTNLLEESNKKIVDRNHFNDFKKDLNRIVRDSERRLISTAPKAVEVRRARERIESAERRILGAFETEMYSQASNILEGANMVDQLIERVEGIARVIEIEHSSVSSNNGWQQVGVSHEAISKLSSRITRHITTTARDSTRQLEALIHLSSRFEDKKLPMPSTGGFAIDAQALGHLIALVEEHRPKKILELGSGTSSVWLGYLCRTYGAELITLDHLEEYLEQTRQALSMHHLDNVKTRLAQLEQIDCHGKTYNWYSLAAFEDLHGIDMLIVDGPPEATGEMARYPALPKLFGAMSPNALVVLDDAHRDTEKLIAKNWSELYPEFKAIEIGASRLAVLHRTA